MRQHGGREEGDAEQQAPDAERAVEPDEQDGDEHGRAQADEARERVTQFSPVPALGPQLRPPADAASAGTRARADASTTEGTPAAATAPRGSTPHRHFTIHPSVPLCGRDTHSLSTPASPGTHQPWSGRKSTRDQQSGQFRQ
jgi:hypothetical protein